MIKIKIEANRRIADCKTCKARSDCYVGHEFPAFWRKKEFVEEIGHRGRCVLGCLERMIRECHPEEGEEGVVELPDLKISFVYSKPPFFLRWLKLPCRFVKVEERKDEVV